MHWSLPEYIGGGTLLASLQDLPLRKYRFNDDDVKNEGQKSKKNEKQQWKDAREKRNAYKDFGETISK